MMLKKLKNQRGTALLVALLVMGVLIAISLALSTLIFRESRITRGLLDAGSAFYSAESGVEIALFALNNKLPGWETKNADYVSFGVGENADGYNSVGELRVKNTCQSYPCLDPEEYDLSQIDTSKFYGVLDLNETVTIPLFVEGKSVSDFAVEFYSLLNPSRDLKINSTELNGWDVLSWKVLGIRKDNENITENISDFTAFSVLQNNVQTSAEKPSWFGTKKCDGEGRLNDKIECISYMVGGAKKEAVAGQVAKSVTGVCLNTQAREYYDYKYFGTDRKIDQENVRACYPIKEFLDSHKLNYLVLTNLVNPGVFRDTELTNDRKEAIKKIYYRVEFFGDGINTSNKTVRDFADITANGYSGDNKQSINVKMRRGGFMPVFNFSLYSTK